MSDYFRPRGDITTVLDRTDRDAQDNTYFPIDASESWFHRSEKSRTIFPVTASVQEFTQRGPADWGQKLSFEIGALPAGDLLQSLILQIRLGSWYNNTTIGQLSNAQITASTNSSANSPDYSSQYWTYINSLGTDIIEYAEFIVGDQTVERISSEFIRTFLNLSDVNTAVGIATDATGTIPYANLSPSVVNQTAFQPNRPFPTENGVYFCVLPFFFLRTRLAEVFPLLSCNEGTVRVDVKLRPFDQMVRKYVGYRASCSDIPLNQSVSFVSLPLTNPVTSVVAKTAVCPPDFADFRILTCCSLVTGSVREKFLHQPFEQMVKLVQTFHFEEPLKYLVSKTVTDVIEIQLPLEINHPVIELLWVFRRKAVIVNNEWSNFGPAIGLETDPSKVYPPWLNYATLRINGLEVISAEGNWFREHIASKHKGGITTYQSHVYGYSFAEFPEIHQPSGTANVSRATSVTLNLRVNVPIAADLTSLPSPCVFDDRVGGWEVFVFAVHYNWLRFENGICNRIFSS